MPVRVVVQDLETASMEIVADLITDTVKKMFNTRSNHSRNSVDLSETLKSFISSLPVLLRETLLHFILEREADEDVKFATFKILLCSQMKTLNIYSFTEPYHKRVIEVIASQGKTLQVMEFQELIFRNNMRCEIKKMLCNLSNLRVLRIPNIVNDDILEVIGKNMPCLRTLDLRGDINVSSDGIELFCKANISHGINNLRAVLLGNPEGNDVSPKCVSLLIKYLPNLQTLGPYPLIKDALELFVEDNGPMQTNLRNLRDTLTNRNNVRLIAQTCPQLKNMCLTNALSNVISSLSVFKHLSDVRFHGFRMSDLMHFLKEGGQTVLSLELLQGNGDLDLHLVSKYCPNLQHLILDQIDQLITPGLVKFYHLRDIEVYYSEIDNATVRSFICGSPNIEKISFGDALYITDRDIYRIFSKGTFTNLKYLWFRNAVHLTTESIRMLVQYCPCLTVLGVVSGWNMTKDEARAIQREYLSQNLALKMIDFFYL